MNNTLLASVDKKTINEFRKDLLEMLRIGKWIDKNYTQENIDLTSYINKFNSLIDTFNKKYKNLKLKLVKNIERMDVKILLNEKNVKSCFENAASKILGVQSIGTANFGAVGVADTEGFTNELEKVKNKLYITYYNPQTGTTNVFLRYDQKEKKVQLVYGLEEIENEPSPEFQLTAYYALKQGFDKKIDLHDEATTLGFSHIPNHVEKASYFRKFDPPISE